MDVIQSQEETQPVSGFGTPGFIPLKLDKEEIDPRTYGEGTGLGNSSGGGGTAFFRTPSRRWKTIQVSGRGGRRETDGASENPNEASGRGRSGSRAARAFV